MPPFDAVYPEPGQGLSVTGLVAGYAEMLMETVALAIAGGERRQSDPSFAIPTNRYAPIGDGFPVGIARQSACRTFGRAMRLREFFGYFLPKKVTTKNAGDIPWKTRRTC